MAYLYIDPSLGSNGSGTAIGPYNTFVGIPWAAGNIYYVRKGTILSENITIGANGSIGSPITIDSYGTGALPIITSGTTNLINANTKSYITLKNLALTATADTATILNIGNSDNIIIDGLEIADGKEGISLNKANNISISNTTVTNCVNGIKGNSSGSTATYNVTIDGVTVTTCSDDGIQFTAGTVAAPGDVYGITIQNSTVNSNLGNGINIVANESATAKTEGYACWGISMSNLTVNSNTKTGLRVRNVLGTQDGKTASTFTSINLDGNCSGDTPGNMWLGAVNDAVISSIISENAQTNDTFDGAGIYLDNACDSVILKESITRNNAGAAGVTSGQGVGLTGTTDCEVYGILSHGNKHGVWCNENTTAFSGTNKIYNNTCVDNTSSQLGWKDNATASTLDFKNNIGYGGDYGVYAEGVTPTAQTEDYNCAFGASNANFEGLTKGTNSITTDPDFIDSSVDNYRIKGASPCKGTGVYDSAVTDKDGNLYNSSAASMGAYEVFAPTGLSVQEAVDSVSTIDVVRIQQTVSVDDTYEAHYVVGISHPYTGKAKWCLVSKSASPSHQASEVLAAMV